MEGAEACWPRWPVAARPAGRPAGCSITLLCPLKPTHPPSPNAEAIRKAITSGFFYHTASLQKNGSYRTVKNPQVRCVSFFLSENLSFFLCMFVGG